MRIIAGVGLLVFAAALGVLLVTGAGEIRVSADPEAAPIPLAAAVVPVLAGMLLVRLVPPRLPALDRAAPDDRPALARQTWALVGLGLAWAVVAAPVGRSWLYGAFKVALLLGGTLLVLRLLPAARPGVRDHLRVLPAWVPWLAPVPAVLAWGYLSFYAPYATRDVSGYAGYDAAVLVGAMLLTFLTASLLEEYFYRVVLQTRLERLHGRWPAVVATALLFTAMHSPRLVDGPLGTNLLVILVFNGGFGLFLGYLWSRHRSVWALVAVHGAVNSLPLLPLLV